MVSINTPQVAQTPPKSTSDLIVENPKKGVLEPQTRLKIGNLDPREPAEDAEDQNIDLETEKIKKSLEEKFDPKKYTISKLVGQGTFGMVYKAKNNHIKKTVAIKKTMQDPKLKNREFEILVCLDHINCIRVHNYYFTNEKVSKEELQKAKKAGLHKNENESSSADSGDSRGSRERSNYPKRAIFLNIVMDYYPENLYGIYRFYGKSKAKLPEALCMLYSYQLIRAVNYLKTLKICHRDIKPQNILINTKTQQLVLCDFGSAKRYSSTESSIAYICSRYYRAPELLLQQEYYDYKIDMWSVGCVLAEMWHGMPLFPGQSSQDQLFRIASILGKPSPKEVVAMNPLYKGPLPEVNAVPLSRVLKSASPLALDLLTKILVYDPKKRIEPLEALKHPYFDQLRLKNLTINGRKIVDLFGFTEQEIGAELVVWNQLVPGWYRKMKQGEK